MNSFPWLKYPLIALTRSSREKIQKVLEGAPGFEPGTSRSAVECSTTELYPHDSNRLHYCTSIWRPSFCAVELSFHTHPNQIDTSVCEIQQPNCTGFWNSVEAHHCCALGVNQIGILTNKYYQISLCNSHISTVEY